MGLDIVQTLQMVLVIAEPLGIMTEVMELRKSLEELKTRQE